MFPTPNNYIRTVRDMPLRGGKNAPPTFRGKYSEVDQFILHYEKLLFQNNVTDHGERCESILQYCSRKVQEFVKASTPNPPNWPALKDAILKYYDSERAQSTYRPSDVVNFAAKYRRKSCTTLTQWKRYYIKYISTAGRLHTTGKLAALDYKGYFWFGIPPTLQQILETILLARHSDHDMSTPYEISEVCAAAESYFKRDKFSMMLIGADRFGIESMDETSDDDSSEEESSEDESDRERRKRQKKKKLLKRKKRSTSTEALTDTKYDNIKKDVKSEEVEGMIRQLNSMSLDDPSYGAIYFKVLSMDTTGIAVKCITRTPRTAASPATYPNSVPLNGGAAYSRPPASQTYPRPDTPRSDSCYGCHDKEHRISDCPKLRELIQNGVIKRDEATRRLTWPDGTPIRRFRDESFVSAV
ncbi:hypothetical protein DFH07DRAFT_733676, partial [Mycena maculata]